MVSFDAAHCPAYSSSSRDSGTSSDHEVGVLDVAELRVLLPAPEEKDLEPGEPLALVGQQRPLQIQPAEQLGPFVGDAGRALPRRAHAADRSTGTAARRAVFRRRGRRYVRPVPPRSVGGAMDAAAVRTALQYYIDRSAAGDEDAAHEIYVADAVLEFPQSGERFEGVPNFKEWRRQYPATSVDLDIRRVRGSGDVWVAEFGVRYDDGPWDFGIDVLEFRGDKVSRETIYWAQAWEAPEWRARWRAPRGRRSSPPPRLPRTFWTPTLSARRCSTTSTSPPPT
jgi:hypothetical protein